MSQGCTTEFRRRFTIGLETLAVMLLNHWDYMEVCIQAASVCSAELEVYKFEIHIAELTEK